MNNVQIIDIERFAIHDGPGIRTVVFFQGCPLHCPWCANPETQRPLKTLMYDRNKCIGCGSCRNICPRSNIVMTDRHPVFSTHFCGNCKECVKSCPQNAIRIAGKSLTTDEILAVILRDKDYYDHSFGGVTLSGGECLLQESAAIELLQSCRQHGIHTAMETSGNICSSSLTNALPWVNLFLFDIKHTDAARLLQTTGASWNLIYSNLQQIVQAHTAEIVLRIPCIPDFNLNDEFFRSLFSLSIDLKIKRIDLLPYHTLGDDKYRQMGRNDQYLAKSYSKELLIPYLEQGKECYLDIRLD